MNRIDFSDRQIIPGYAYDTINRIFDAAAPGRSSPTFANQFAPVSEDKVKRRLGEIHGDISKFSMYLPVGFSQGLNRQFANMMDEDAWEDDDELIDRSALNTFLNTLYATRTLVRPVIGTNGRGSVTAFWHSGSDFLTIDSYANGKVAWALAKTLGTHEPEQAAGRSTTSRILDVLSPFDPEVWFAE